MEHQINVLNILSNVPLCCGPVNLSRWLLPSAGAAQNFAAGMMQRSTNGSPYQTWICARGAAASPVRWAFPGPFGGCQPLPFFSSKTWVVILHFHSITFPPENCFAASKVPFWITAVPSRRERGHGAGPPVLGGGVVIFVLMCPFNTPKDHAVPAGRVSQTLIRFVWFV